MDWDAFLDFQESLPRQGPGDRASQDFALRIVGAGRDQKMCDAGCGVGPDIEGLLAWAPEGSVLAVDTHPGFVAKVQERYGNDPRVTAEVRDMATLTGPFDLIWCAGALYFLGLEAGLAAFRKALAPGGAVLFSHPAWFTEAPSDPARAFWEGEDATIQQAGEICEAVRAAGFDVLDASSLPDAAWEAYYTPMEARIAELRPGTSDGMAGVLDAAEAEIAGWRAAKAETGYLQVVAVRR